MEKQAAAIEAKMEAKVKAKAHEKEEAKETKPVEAKKVAQKGFALELADFGYLKYPLMTEKAIMLIEKENKISFIAHETATKGDIKKLIEKVYGVKVVKVNVVNDMKGRKKVSVKLDKKYKAEELAAKLGVN
mgnify:CR=1 FL=1